MEGFYDELSHVLDQPNPMDASDSMEPPFSFPPEPFPSTTDGSAMICTPMGSPEPTFPTKPNLHIDVCNHRPASPKPSLPFASTTNDQFTFMPTPTLAPRPTSNNPVTAVDQLGFCMGPFPSRNLPPASYYDAERQTPADRTECQPFSRNPELRFGHMGPAGNLVDQNWEAMASFLAGQVRPGDDVRRVYKCSVCSVEFPNAQAYGGHMSSHSRMKKGGGPMGSAAARLKKAMRCGAMKGKGGARSGALKGAKNKKKGEEY